MKLKAPIILAVIAIIVLVVLYLFLPGPRGAEDQIKPPTLQETPWEEEERREEPEAEQPTRPAREEAIREAVPPAQREQLEPEQQ